MQRKVRIATHSDKELGKAPAAVSLITSNDIKATGAANLVDVLRSVPGLHIRYQHFGYRPLIGFRGANDKQTLLLVDGAPFSDLMWRQGIFWKGLPASAIDRVEIIRGPGSALFGTDASAGVINVITKAAGKIEHSEAGMRAGSYDTGAAWIQHGDQWNGFDVAFTADFSTANGFDPFIARDAQSQSDDTRGTNASFAPGNAYYGWDNTDLRFSIARNQWRLMMDYSEQDNLQTGMTGAGAIDRVTEGNSSRFNAAFLFEEERFSKDWGAKGELRYRHLDYSSGDGFQEWPPGHVDDTGLYPSGVLNLMSSAENSVSGEISGTYRGVSDHQVTVGAGFRWQDIYKVRHLVNSGMDASGNTLPAGGPLVDVSDSPYAFAPEKSRTITYLFLQDAWNISEQLELTAGARFDHNSDYGESFNPRLALVWRPHTDVTTKFLYGQAFRAPYFQELYTETSFSLPNPDLEPEKSETFEFAIDYMPNNRSRLGVNLFRYQQTDTISLQSVPGLAKRQYQNAGDHNINGLELEASWQPVHGVSISGNYSFNDPDDGQRAFGKPSQIANLRLDWELAPKWHWNIQGHWTGSIERSPNDLRADLDENFLTDTTLRYTGIRDWELSLSIRNLFDTDAYAATSSSIPGDLPLPDRQVYFEARYDLDRLLRK